jgi:vacuolar-type H+-ATPase subunit H
MELLFFSCLILVCIIYGIDRHHQKRSEAILTSAIANNAEYTAKLEKRLEELSEKFNDLDGTTTSAEAAEFERAWQEGVQSIMNYSLNAAMGGKLNE